MAPSRDASDEESFDFNDLSRPTSTDKQADAGSNGNANYNNANDASKSTARIACVLCRKRKLKCDSRRPACSTCVRLQHDCSYDEVRKKSGPKRGYVKALEARLAQVETLLKTQDEPAAERSGSDGNVQPRGQGGLSDIDSHHHHQQDAGLASDMVDFSLDRNDIEMLRNLAPTNGYQEPPGHSADPLDMLNPANIPDVHPDDASSWELIGLGLDEPLPNQDVIDELNEIYFNKVHPSIVMIHRARYYAAMNLAPHMRPPVCLRYAMWASAASLSSTYEAMAEHFYARARKYMHQDEMRGHGEGMITVSHAQTWVLLGTYEFKLMCFPRAWMSAGRACRMTLMMGLHRLDGAGLDVKQCLPPPKDWTEREERRRTFWASFCIDRYASIGTGWPMVVDERDIVTTLPSDEDSYQFSRPQTTVGLEDVLHPSGVAQLSSCSGVVLMACLFGRNLTHLHRPGPDDRDDDPNGGFWKRHRALDNILLGTALALPDSLRLPAGLNNPNIIFMNMSIHTSTICLHQAAIFKADRSRTAAHVSAESKIRCITAAAEIATIMRTASHLDLAAMNPFISFCLYVAARVFVQYLKSRPKDGQVRASLQFLLSAMHAIKRKNPLTESFLVQLDVDLEGAGLEDANYYRAQMPWKAPGSGAPSAPCPVDRSLGPAPSNYAGDGTTAYSNPDRSKRPSAPSSTGSFGGGGGGGGGGGRGYNGNQDISASGGFGFNPSPGDNYAGQFDLPNRQRTPGLLSNKNSSSTTAYHRSPQNLHPADMDTSPDGAGDHNTPNSSSQQNLSSHTSHTGYSPSNQPLSHPTQSRSQSHSQSHSHSNQQPPSTSSAMDTQDLFDPAAFSTDFDMHSFPNTNTNTTSSSSAGDAQQQPAAGTGFVLPPGWGGPTGMTPGASTGMTPGASTGLTPGPDMVGMSDAEWSQMLDGFGSWETGTLLEHTDQMAAFMASGKR